MRISRRIVASAASLALIAGVGVAMSAPASAAHNHNQDTQSGKAILQLSPSFVALAKTASVTFGVKGKYATKKTPNGGVSIEFPVTGDPVDGAIFTKGKMTTSGPKGTMVFVNPIFGWATSQTNSRVQGSITGVLHQMRYPYSYLNGQTESLYDLTAVKTETTWGKTKQLFGGATRTSTTKVWANVQMTQDANILDALDWGVAAPLFQAAAPVGTAWAKQVVVHSCASAQECNNLSK